MWRGYWVHEGLKKGEERDGEVRRRLREIAFRANCEGQGLTVMQDLDCEFHKLKK